jgi:signal transduction histidine kinase
MDASTGEIEWWMEGAKDGYRFLQSYHVDNFNHKTHIEQFEHWKKGTVYATVKVSGKEKIEYDDFYFTKSGFKLVPEETKKMLMQLETLVFSMAFMQYGAVCWAPNPIDDTDAKILQRFAKVFEQTYTRFLDLQKAEHQAREAVKQASLDRVRGEIASMRSQQDLDRITPLIWTELHNLGIRFSRCGIFIMDIPNEEVNIFLSSPQGKAIAAFDLDFRKINLQQVVEHWNKHEILVTHWSQKEFAELAEILVHEGIIKDHSHYLDTLPNTGQYLHYIPFLQGMLYVAHTESLKQEELELVKSLADSFSVAYARYEDFSRMEAAKLRTEKALNELKQTQAQLIQSEKMASLGELTAGIAHEIQNPLNFVNNFSDLNKELIEELQAELKKGDIREATSISESLKENEEKINIHGRRADGIVKSMLQHSRASGGQKEPTDINKLVDEYVRLAYHGYRARQKDFNVTLDIRLDPEAGQVKMVAQDIGRVLLNLLNNAFQAVNEKSRSGGDGYQPTVTVSTMRSPRGIDIRVEDNGPGIPDEIKDKIFQPFFTTRPTGEGTGLGLSLSYDIMKAHGGTITLQQNEGQGSVFTLEIPANPLNTGK